MCSPCFRGSDVQYKTADLNDNNNFGGKRNRTRFYCCGSVPPTGLYRKRHGMFGRQAVNEGIEAAKEVEEYVGLQGLTKIENPDIPFIGEIPEQLYQGRAIEIHGSVLSNPNRFSINLTTDISADADIGLHFNPRFDRRVVVRNHFIKCRWGEEEIVSPHKFPFKASKGFSVLIFIADDVFLIAVNQPHWCSFAFRVPLEQLRYVVIQGDIKCSLIQHYDRLVYPTLHAAKLPYILLPKSSKEDGRCTFQRRSKTLSDGTKIIIRGRMKLLPDSFYVNLQCGNQVWPHPVIPMHMNLRLHQPGAKRVEKQIIFNSWNGGWGKEEFAAETPFRPGKPFMLFILVGQNGYTVHVDNKFLHKFTARFKSAANDINTLVIQGDVMVSSVVVK